MKLSLLLLYGGRSGEHEVSVASAQSVAAAINREKYDLVEVVVSPDGIWRTPKGDTRHLLPIPGVGYLLDQNGQQAEKIDVVFPLIHGTFGEDGCIQGLLEIIEIPYVGSGVLGSALGMDKELQKQLLKSVGLPVIDFVSFKRREWDVGHGELVEKIEREIGYPNFVKPVNMGSSIGITKATDQRRLLAGVEEALRFDSKIIVERAVNKAREIECGVLGTDAPAASILGEIKSEKEFYDYEAKYLSNKTELLIPAPLDEAVAERIRNTAIEVFRRLETEGFGRVDFLMDGDTGRFWINEINTLPGFTDRSMFPKLWEATGVPYVELIERLIDLALERAKLKATLCRDYFIGKK